MAKGEPWRIRMAIGRLGLWRYQCATAHDGRPGIVGIPWTFKDFAVPVSTPISMSGFKPQIDNWLAKTVACSLDGQNW